MKYQNTLSVKTLFCLVLLFLSNKLISQNIWNPSHKVGTNTGVYNYSVGQTPAQFVEIFPAGIPNTGITYEWEMSDNPAFLNSSLVATTSSYSPGIITSTTPTRYYRRKSKRSIFDFIYSNIIKISVVSSNWEDINYLREHIVRTSDVTTWYGVDQLAIGPKLQKTTYLDGIGRPIERVSRESATPSSGTLWADVVEYLNYDALTGRETKKALPYTTTTQSGKFKTNPETEQTQYYTTIYGDAYGYTSIDKEKSPLSRVQTVNLPGSSWRVGVATGTIAEYELNSLSDNVQNFSLDYISGNPPVNNGPYPANTLYKSITTDETGKRIVEYRNISGQLILKKVELDASPSFSHSGWICTYSIYDDKGLLRYQIQPEGVKYLDQNSWSFAGTNGQKVLNEYCFQYSYDEKGRVIWKKAPGVLPLNIIYDGRDRTVFTQDGNQSVLTIPQWTAILYDELDRPVISTLYNTTKNKEDLQTDIQNSISVTNLSIINPGQPLMDLVVDTRNTNILLYLAQNSIEFVDGFESTVNDEFTAEINSSVTLPSSVNVVTYNNPIAEIDLNTSSKTTILKYLFYDDYNFENIKSFNTNFTNLAAYNTSDPDVIPIIKSNRTISMTTGTKTRVLGSNVFLNSTNYYDERGQLIQTLEDNLKSGTDISTIQHHFDGSEISICADHTTTNTGYTNFKILTKYLFDKIGRVTTLQKQFGSNTMKTFSSFDYDDLGRRKIKHLDPGYTSNGGTELESLNYSYNIHNQIIGINKDYALKSPGNYDKWSHFFGVYFGFDKTDNIFTASNLNGQMTGQLWNTQGDDVQRKFDYTYDNAGRLTSSTFREQQHPGNGFSNSQMDFSVSGTSGKTTYDLNGNLLNMLHKGVVPGSSSPITVDNLVYSYGSTYPYSNKLESVTDQMTSTTVNGMFGDFKDGSNGSTPDYVYDDNGNVIVDLNKNVQNLNGGGAGIKGISYNLLDKPELIRIVGKGTIKIIYDADGQQLQRAFIPEAGGASNITTYIKGFIYQESSTITTASPAPLGGGTATLSFINFEDGRIRPVTQVPLQVGDDMLGVDGNIDLPNGKRGAIDFFIMDYQQNVRMILTEEIHTAANKATMEIGRSTVEESIFGQTGGGNEVATTRTARPSGWTNSSVGNSVSGLGTNIGHNVGPNVLQKVMAGDKITTSVDYYFTSSATGSNSGFLSTVTGSLAQAISGSYVAGNLVKNNSSLITTQLGGVSDFVGAVQPDGSNPPNGTPQAYLTVLFFDERFKIIPEADGGIAQEQVASSVGSNGMSLGNTLANLKAPKNGYVYVYISNQSNETVYFDNLLVRIDQGNIIEENHYYSYGLKIAALSSKKAGDSNEGVLKNSYLYNEKELIDDADMNWHDYGFRNYDAQIGRFVQTDPLADQFPFFAPYLYAGNEPVGNIDLFGLAPFGTGGETALTAATAKVTEGAIVNCIRSTNIVGKATSLGFEAARFAISSVIINISKIVPNIITQQVGPPVHYSVSQLGDLTDLTQTEYLGRENPRALYNYDYWGGDKEALQEFKTVFGAATRFMKAEASDLFDHFVDGDGSTLHFGPESYIAEKIQDLSSFKSYAELFETAVLEHLATHKDLSGFKGDEYLSQNRPSKFGNSDIYLNAVMGGWKRFDVEVTVISKDQIRVNYRFTDHFGAGVNDSYSNTPGVQALYFLQHHRGRRFKYKPFRWDVNFSHEVKRPKK